MVNRENLEQAINEAMENGDTELLEILLKLREEPVTFNNDTKPVKQKKIDTRNLNIKQIAEYFKQ